MTTYSEAVCYAGQHKKRVYARMWANAQRDGCPADIHGALCSATQSLADAHYYSAVQ